MRMLGRTVSVLGLASLALAPSLAAQVTGFESFKWYFGAQAGLTIFETPSQTKGGIFTAGGHFLVTAKRTGLLISVEESFKNNQVSVYSDAAAAGGQRQVNFNNLRKYQATILAFPFNTIAQPYIGLGFGLLQTVKEYPQGVFLTPAELGDAQDAADQAGSHTFGSLVGGVQFRVSSFVLFGQYAITSSPVRGKLLIGPTHTFSGGLRIGLGGSKDDGANGGPTTVD
jgi:hypothetical protein